MSQISLDLPIVGQRFRNMEATVKCLGLGNGDGMTHFIIVILFLIFY